MTILIHPTLQRRPSSLEMLRRKTGMVDVVTKNAVKLVTQKNPSPACHNIILECSSCGYKTNMLLRGEVCTHCKKGNMFDPWNGGSAA